MLELVLLGLGMVAFGGDASSSSTTPPLRFRVLVGERPGGWLSTASITYLGGVWAYDNGAGVRGTAATIREAVIDYLANLAPKTGEAIVVAAYQGDRVESLAAVRVLGDADGKRWAAYLGSETSGEVLPPLQYDSRAEAVSGAIAWMLGELGR